MRSVLFGLWITAFLTVSMTSYASGQSRRAETTRNKSKVQQSSSKRNPSPSAKIGKRGSQRANKHAQQAQGCSRCPVQVAAKNNSRAAKKIAKPAACHPKGYVDPAIARNYNAAMRDLRRAGLDPKVTSTFRSSADQARLHRCSHSRRCRRAHPGLYYALPPGESLHEAGFAVDMSGVAIGPRGAKRLTPRGRRMIAIMRKHGFSWRYGLADPAHFEIDPRNYGYRSAQQAMRRNQTQCQPRYIANAKTGRGSTIALKPASAKRKESGARRLLARNR
jgi:LAS superfamily LD-carboxypeptidase LdcB